MIDESHKLDQAMLSFALMGGMLVSRKPRPKPAERPTVARAPARG